MAAAVDDQVFVVGGAEIYAATLPYADRLVLTEVDQEPDGDTFFPAYDRSAWREASRDEHEGFAIVTVRADAADPGGRPTASTARPSARGAVAAVA